MSLKPAESTKNLTVIIFFRIFSVLSFRNRKAWWTIGHLGTPFLYAIVKRLNAILFVENYKKRKKLLVFPDCLESYTLSQT